MANAQKRESSYYVLTRSDIDLYLQDVASRGCKQGTLENYRRSLLNFFDWLPEGKRVSREKVYEYQEYLIRKIHFQNGQHEDDRHQWDFRLFRLA